MGVLGPKPKTIPIIGFGRGYNFFFGVLQTLSTCNSVGIHCEKYFSVKSMICLIFSVYLEIGAADTDQGALEFTFDGGNDNGRQFEVKVTQILCNSASRYFLKSSNTNQLFHFLRLIILMIRT